AAPCQARHGANGRACRREALATPSQVAWRKGRKKRKDAPEVRQDGQPKSLSSQRARAALGRRGPSLVLRTIAAAARRRERLAADSHASLPASLNSLWGTLAKRPV